MLEPTGSPAFHMEPISTSYKPLDPMTTLNPELDPDIDASKIRPVVKLDLDRYAKMWTRNDLWRMATISFNLDISVDCIYDHVIRFMRNVIEKYPDGYIGIASHTDICDMSGWPLNDAWAWPVYAMLPSTTYSFSARPHDGFIQRVPASKEIKEYILERMPQPSDNPKADTVLYEKYKNKYYPNGILLEREFVLDPNNNCTLAVLDIDKWKRYIAEGDPEIGQGEWGAVDINSGPTRSFTEILMKAIGGDLSTWRFPALACVPGKLPDDVIRILQAGLKDRPWEEVLPLM